MEKDILPDGLMINRIINLIKNRGLSRPQVLCNLEEEGLTGVVFWAKGEILTCANEGRHAPGQGQW